MKNFIAIDFETANPQRVSACSLGIVYVEDGVIKNSKSFLIKPVGGHAPFQTRIHGIKEEDTSDKPDFKEIISEIEDIFNKPLVGHSLFDKQVLNALSNHFDLNLNFEYFDSSSIAKQKLPHLKNHKLKTLVKHFELPEFKHHDAGEDAQACAKILLKLYELNSCKIEIQSGSKAEEFKELIIDILADDEVNYREAYQLLYWLNDHSEYAKEHKELHNKVKEVLEDDYLDDIEALELKIYLKKTLKNIQEENSNSIGSSRALF